MAARNPGSAERAPHPQEGGTTRSLIKGGSTIHFALKKGLAVSLALGYVATPLIFNQYTF